MACDEVRGGYKVRGLDRGVSEPEVRAGISAGLLGVIVEVSLAVFLGVVADDLDGVLVGSDSTV